MQMLLPVPPVRLSLPLTAVTAFCPPHLPAPRTRSTAYPEYQRFSFEGKSYEIPYECSFRYGPWN